jgi:hypothetical protein
LRGMCAPGDAMTNDEPTLRAMMLLEAALAHVRRDGAQSVDLCLTMRDGVSHYYTCGMSDADAALFVVPHEGGVQ